MMTEHPETVKTYLAGLYNERLRRLACRASSTDEYWKNIDADVMRYASLSGLGELLKCGCTTCFDHHYVFPAGAGDLIGAQFAASDEIGARMYASRRASGSAGISAWMAAMSSSVRRTSTTRENCPCPPSAWMQDSSPGWS